MNPVSQEEAEDIFEGIKNGIGDTSAEVVVCPPFVYLPLLKGLTIGAQNVFYSDGHALTGGISGAMLKDLGVEYVIIGHSESRRYLKETDEIVNKKIKESLENKLKVIFCTGETAEEKDAGKKNEVLERQIRIGLAGVGDLENINVAYEPVWAIGTGNNCPPGEAKSSIDFIRKLAKVSRILYGGSVKSENSGDYVKSAGANGLLVGGASLNPEEFVKIVKSAE